VKPCPAFLGGFRHAKIGGCPPVFFRFTIA
jgi:hypothetical protein